MAALPLSRQQQQQQYLHQQQENYFSTGLATPPLPPGAISSQTPTTPHSSAYLSSPIGGVGLGGATDLAATPPRFYDSYSTSAYSPTFASPGGAGLGAGAHTPLPLGAVQFQQQQHDGSVSNLRTQMSGYWPSPLSPGASRSTPTFGASGIGHTSYAGSPIQYNSPLHYDAHAHSQAEYFQVQPASYSPLAVGRKSDGFEPMNTSPTVQQHQQMHSPWQYSPSRGYGHGYTHASGGSLMGSMGYASGVGYPPGSVPVQMFNPPQQHYSFFGNDPDTPPPTTPVLGRSSSLKDLSTSGVGAKDIAAAAAAFHRSKQLFETPPKGGTAAGATTKSGPPVFGLGNYDDADDDGPRILRHATSSPNLSMDKRRGGTGASLDGSGGKKARQFGPSPSGSATSILASTPKSNTPVSPSSSGGSGANTPTLSTWVTVFGFSAAATSYVISHFGQFGTIIETKCVPGSNWIHIKFSNKFEARRALNKNGSVISGNMMLGIMPYNPDVAAEEGGGLPTVVPVPLRAPASAKVGGGQSGHSGGGDAAGPSSGAGAGAGAPTSSPTEAATREVKARLRPLAHTGYLGTNPLPKENRGLVSRALEFLLGW